MDSIEPLIENLGNFDQRFQHLLDDFAFLFQIDEINSWETVLYTISDVDKRDEVGDWEIWDSRIQYSNEKEFAIALAQIARLIIEQDQTYDYEEIVWGFIVGLLSESIENFEEEEEAINQMLDSFDEYILRRRERALTEIETSDNGLMRSEDVQAIKNLGFVPTDVLINLGSERRLKLWPEMNIELDGGGAYELHEYEVKKFEKLWERILMDLASEAPELTKIQSLRQDIDEDYEDLTRKGWNGIRPVDVVRSISERGGKAESKKIADDISDWRSDMNPQNPGVGKVGRDLAGQGEDTVGQNWTEKPVLELASEDLQKWRLTKYGNLLSYTKMGNEDSYNELHAYALAPDGCMKESLISQVLEEHYQQSINKIVNTVKYRTTKEIEGKL